MATQIISRPSISARKSTGAAAGPTINLPVRLLRSFVAIVETGSMLNASLRVNVTQSALSLQIKRLEELLQQSVFERVGRRLAPTQAGTLLLDYARRVLALHDEALTAVRNDPVDQPIRLGLIQDFAEGLLTDLLERFAALYPTRRIHARVASSAELQALLDNGALDLMIGYTRASDPDALRITPMRWYGQPATVERDVVPLAVLEEPCRFRQAAIAELDAAGRAYRIAVETPNLSSLRAAVEAGMGLTCRIDGFLEGDVLSEDDLPALPDAAVCVRHRTRAGSPAAAFAAIAIDALKSAKAPGR